jgi:hypothetical protein
VVHARKIIGGIVGARDMEHDGEVTVVLPLMESREPPETKLWAGAPVIGNRAAAMPGNGGDIVAHGWCGWWPHIDRHGR